MRTIKELKSFSRKNKNRDVPAEKTFRKLLTTWGIHFQKQKVIGNYIVDFYLPKRNLIIEIDEKHHEHKKSYDKSRQAILEGYGFTIMRFSDTTVYENPYECIVKIHGIREDNEWYRECKKRLQIINSRRTV